jgi:hypothetical protein
LKLKLDKSIEKLSERLDVIEEETSGEETDYENEARFAKLREVRAKKTNAFGNKTYEDVWDGTTQEEIDYYKRKNLEVPPEVRYQTQKKAWHFHKSCWYMRHDNGYDGYGCINGVCVPECRFYPEDGRIEDEEVESCYEDKRRIINS